MKRILESWKGKVVEVLLREGSGRIELALLEDFDDRGAYLTTEIITKMGFDTLVDEGFYFWDRISTLRPWKPDKDEIEYIPEEYRKYLVK